MSIKFWAVMVVSCCAIASVGYGSTGSRALNNVKPWDLRPVRRDINDVGFVRVHFRDSLEPLLKGFREKFGQRETGLMITTQIDEYGTVVVRAKITFQSDIPALTLAETYTPIKINRLKKNYG